MAKKAKIAPRQEPLPKLPFSMCDRAAFINRPWVAMERAGKDFLYCIYFAFATGDVRCSVVGIADIDNYREGHGGVKPFYVDGYHTGSGPTGLAKTHLQWLLKRALEGGATPDAIRFMASALKLTKKEQDTMAKAATAKKATGTKPVAGGGKLGKKGGNPEALEKAREAAAARNAENAKQKITVVAKPGDLKLRGGRKAKFEHVAKSKPKTVGDVLGTEVTDDEGNTHKIDMGALRGMEKRGHIKIG